MKERRALKKKIIELLQASDLDGVLALLDEFTRKDLLNPLIACLCNSNERVKWLAVSAIGKVVAGIADEVMEEGRIIMRRFMWMLNDESGGIGWGVPEAMGEVMACHRGLADEFSQILVANMREDGNFLELEMLQRGLMWGIGRLGGVRPDLMEKWRAGAYLLPYLDSQDHEVRGRAVWALGQIGETNSERLSSLKATPGTVTIYENFAFAYLYCWRDSCGGIAMKKICAWCQKTLATLTRVQGKIRTRLLTESALIAPGRFCLSRRNPWPVFLIDSLGLFLL